MLCIDDAMYMLDIHCYVHVVSRACCTYGSMYIWCCVNVVHMVLYTYGFVCMIVQVVL